MNRRTALIGVGALAFAPGGACGSPFHTEQLRGPTPRWADVEPEALASLPYASIGSLGAWRGPQLTRHFGTAWICGPRRAATAAHVIEDALSHSLTGGEALRLKLGFTHGGHPQQDIELSAAQLKSHPSARSDPVYDIGVIDCALNGASLLGGVSQETTSDIFISGYPVLRRRPTYAGDVLVAHSGRAWRREKYLIHDTDTTPGHSGSPMMRTRAGRLEAIGLHVAPDFGRDNRGIWINEELALYLRS